MNNLRDALAERIDAVGPARPDVNTLVALGEARLRRHRRRRTAVVGGSLAAVAALAIVLGGGQAHDTTPKPVGPATIPPAVPGGKVLASDPYIGTHFWGRNIRQPGWPPQLSPCDDPRTWGADEIQGATFFGRHPHNNFVRVNEFFLQYPDATTAERAAEQATHQVMNCPSPGRPFGQSPPPHSIYHLAPSGTHQVEKSLETPLGWVTRTVNRHDNYDTYAVISRVYSGNRNTPEWRNHYVYRVARARNWLVVLESLGTSDDRSSVSLEAAAHKALPQYHWSR